MLFSDSRRNAFCVRTGCFLFAVTMLLSCATEENSSSSKCSSSDDPTSVCYSPRGDFFLFEDLYNDGVFSKAEVKQIAHWNNTPNTSRNTGNDSETIVSVPTLDPSTERTICYDYYNDYYFVLFLLKNKSDISHLKLNLFLELNDMYDLYICLNLLFLLCLMICLILLII